MSEHSLFSNKLLTGGIVLVTVAGALLGLLAIVINIQQRAKDTPSNASGAWYATTAFMNRAPYSTASTNITILQSPVNTTDSVSLSFLTDGTSISPSLPSGAIIIAAILELTNQSTVTVDTTLSIKSIINSDAANYDLTQNTNAYSTATRTYPITSSLPIDQMFQVNVTNIVSEWYAKNGTGNKKVALNIRSTNSTTPFSFYGQYDGTRKYKQPKLKLIYENAVSSSVSSTSSVTSSSSSTSISSTSIAADTKADIKTSGGKLTEFRVGFTYENPGQDKEGNQAYKDSANSLSRETLSFQNTHMQIFGPTFIWTDCNQRDPAKWDWVSLDNRIAQMRIAKSNGGPEMMITLGMASNFMTLAGCPNARNNGEQYSLNEARPTTDHFDDFAYLSAQVAKRYPDVKYFQVWNEEKGFYGNSRWAYEDLTNLYNKVYTAVKAVRPESKIGGPYPVLDASGTATIGGEIKQQNKAECNGSNFTLDGKIIGNDSADVNNSSTMGWWLSHNVGADYLVYDSATIANRGTTANYNEFDVAEYIQKQIACIKGLKDKNGNPFPQASHTPIGVAEFYPRTLNKDNNTTRYAAITANALGEQFNAGIAYSLLWNNVSYDCLGTAGDSLLALWFKDGCANAGTATKLGPVLKSIKQILTGAPDSGLTIQSTNYDKTKVGLFASNKGYLLINKLNKNQTISINGCPVITLNPYQVYSKVGLACN